MANVEAVPGLYANMEKYSLTYDDIRNTIAGYWEAGGTDYYELMDLMQAEFDPEDRTWIRKVIAGLWSDMMHGSGDD